MHKNYYITLLLRKNIEIYNRIANKIEELLRKNLSHEEMKLEVEDLMQSLEYVIQEMRHIISTK